jgi:hypothetical protein
MAVTPLVGLLAFVNSKSSEKPKQSHPVRIGTEVRLFNARNLLALPNQ